MSVLGHLALLFQGQCQSRTSWLGDPREATERTEGRTEPQYATQELSFSDLTYTSPIPGDATIFQEQHKMQTKVLADGYLRD